MEPWFETSLFRIPVGADVLEDARASNCPGNVFVGLQLETLGKPSRNLTKVPVDVLSLGPQ